MLSGAWAGPYGVNGVHGCLFLPRSIDLILDLVSSVEIIFFGFSWFGVWGA